MEQSSIFPGIGGVDGQVLVNFRRDLNIETGLGGQCHQSVSTQKLDDSHHPGVCWLAEQGVPSLKRRLARGHHRTPPFQVFDAPGNHEGKAYWVTGTGRAVGHFFS